MKKNMILCGIVAASVAGLVGFNSSQTGISGKVTPQDGAESVWAIGTDSTKGIITSGNFSIQVKPGTYKVFVDARDPFKDVSLENLEVRDGQPLDVGEIVLQK
jgi:hypothetical protein